jgi:hypothetical protein
VVRVPNTEVENYARKVITPEAETEAKWYFAAFASLILTVILPFLLITPNVSVGVQTPLVIITLLTAWLPLAISVVAAAFPRLRDGHADGNSHSMGTTMLIALIFGLTFLAITWLSGSDRNIAGYSLLSSNFWVYVILGIASATAYGLLIRWSFRGTTWMTYVGAIIALPAAWYWPGYAAYLVGGTLW